MTAKEKEIFTTEEAAEMMGCSPSIGVMWIPSSVDATSQAMVWCWVSAWLGEPLGHPGAPGRALPT